MLSIALTKDCLSSKSSSLSPPHTRSYQWRVVGVSKDQTILPKATKNDAPFPPKLNLSSTSRLGCETIANIKNFNQKSRPYDAGAPALYGAAVATIFTPSGTCPDQYLSTNMSQEVRGASREPCSVAVGLYFWIPWR